MHEEVLKDTCYVLATRGTTHLVLEQCKDMLRAEQRMGRTHLGSHHSYDFGQQYGAKGFTENLCILSDLFRVPFSSQSSPGLHR